MTRKIFITGCARSGTTLLNRLFYSCRDVEVIDYEISLEEFCKLKSNSLVLVGKRTPVSIYSVPLSKDLLMEQIKIIKNENIKILNIIRDGRDVVHRDKPGYPNVNLDRWIGCVEHVFKHRDIITLNIKYEDLVRTPDKIQNEILKAFSLNIAHNFSSYPDFVNDEVFDSWELSHLPNYKKRKIELTSIGHNSSEYISRATSKKEIKQFEYLLKKLNYI